MIFYEKWCEAGIFFINDLLDENNEFYSYDSFKTKYNIRLNYLTFIGVLHMIPQIWKMKIKETTKIETITCEILEHVRKNKKSCQYFYSKYISLYALTPEKQEGRWREAFEIDDSFNWEFIYKLPFMCTNNHKFIIFHLRIN